MSIEEEVKQWKKDMHDYVLSNLIDNVWLMYEEVKCPRGPNCYHGHWFYPDEPSFIYFTVWETPVVEDVLQVVFIKEKLS